MCGGCIVSANRQKIWIVIFYEVQVYDMHELHKLYIAIAGLFGCELSKLGFRARDHDTCSYLMDLLKVADNIHVHAGGVVGVTPDWLSL